MTTRDLDTTRRRFVAYFASAGLAPTLLPGVLWARVQEEPAGPITSAMLTDALVPRIFNYYTKSGSPCVSSVRWAKRAIDSRIWSADLVHLNGFGSSLWASR